MTLLARLLVPAALAAAAQSPAPQQIAPETTPEQTSMPEGLWRGTSICTPQAGWCENHDIVIEVTRTPAPGLYNARFSIVRNGVETLDNRLAMTFDSNHVLTGHYIDERRASALYILAIHGDIMHGILLVNTRLITRGLDLKRVPPEVTALPEGGDGSSSASSPSAN